jgi:hypothetical protein
MIPKLEVIRQIECLEPQDLRTVLKELLQLNSNLSIKIDQLSEEVRELNNRTVGLCK